MIMTLGFSCQAAGLSQARQVKTLASVESKRSEAVTCLYYCPASQLMGPGLAR
jgi:hypothetical protein